MKSVVTSKKQLIPFLQEDLHQFYLSCRWADISEPDFGMSVLNESKYGWEGRGNSLSLTLLKSPKAPDFNCDMQVHNFQYAVMPHSGKTIIIINN